MIELGEVRRVVRGLGQRAAPGPQVRTHRGEVVATEGRDQVGCHDVERRPVRDQRVGDEQQRAVLRRSGVEPHDLQGATGLRVEAIDRGRRLGGDHGVTGRGSETGDVDPRQGVGGDERTGSADRQRPQAGRVPAQPLAQPVVVVDDGLQGRGQPLRARAGGGGKPQRLVVGAEVAAPLPQAVHARERGQRPDRREVAESPAGDRTGAAAGHPPGQLARGRGLEHVAQREVEPGATRPPHDGDGDDAVAAEGEEVVVRADRIDVEVEHTGEQRPQAVDGLGPGRGRVTAGSRRGR